MKNMLFKLIFSLIVIGISPLHAETNADKGKEIIRVVNKNNTGWGTSEAKMEMILKNQRGDESIRKIRIKTLEMKDDGDKGLTIFDEPLDVAGTAFLSFSHPLEADEQWIYLPALKRVKRISSSNKSGPFMGSEFSYEDISSFEVEKYSYQYLREEKLDEYETFVIELTPLYENSGYTKEVVWVDKTDYIFRKIDYYDRKKSLLKTLTFSNYKQFKNQFWRALTMEMVNFQRHKSTTLSWTDYQFDVSLSESDFNKANLTRAR